MMAVVKVDEAVEEVAAEARCADVAVEEKEVVAVVAVEVETVAAGAARETMTGSLETTELESRLKTREEAAARATGEPLRMMCLRRVRRRTQPSTLKARKKSQPSRRSQRLPENSLLKSWRQSLPGKRRRSRCPWTNGKPSKPRRRVPSSTCGKLVRDPTLTPSGRRRRSTRRRMRRRMTRRRRKPLSTFSDQLARRSLTSTSPLLTKVDVAEVTVDVGVVAVAKDGDVGVVDAVMAKDAHPTGSAAKVRRVNVAPQGSPGSQDLRERKASNSQGEVEVKEAEVAAVERDGDAARAVDVVKDVVHEVAVANPAENSASTRRLSPPWGNEEHREERSYDLLILYREHSSEEHKIKKILPQRFYVFLSIFYTTPKKNIEIQFP